MGICREVSVKIFSLALLCLSSAAFAGDVEFAAFSTTTTLNNLEASTCAETVQAKLQGRAPVLNLPRLYFSIPNPKLSFSSSDSDESVQITEITFDFRSPYVAGGEYRCSISGEELAATFANQQGQPWNSSLKVGESREASKLCPALKCGGIALVADKPFRVPLSISVKGMERNRRTGANFPRDWSRSFLLYYFR